MPTRSRDRAERPSHPPLWLVEGLDIVSRKWVLLSAVTGAVIVLGAIAALLLPEVVPPAPAVGAAVGLGGLLLGLAAAVATDATDLVVRGPRHVAAAGGELVAVLPRDPSVAAAGPLAAAVLEVREPGVPLLLAFATASRDARRSSAWTDAIARSLVSEGVGVLRVDLASGRSEHPVLVEVVRDGTKLAEAVTFEPGVKLAQLSAGRDHADALAALTELPGRLPRDLDIMLVSLPTAASRSVVAAAAALDHVLIIVERDRTSRVDLIASLDALEAAGTHAQVVLLDTSTAMRLAPPVEVDPAAEAERRRTISSTVGTSPVVVPGSDGEPVPVPEDEPVAGFVDELGGEEPVLDDEAVAELEDELGGEEPVSDDEDLDDEPESGDEDAAEDEPAADTGDDEPLTAEDDREAPAFGGPLTAGVAGAGVAAGLGALMPDAEEDVAGDEAAAIDESMAGEPEPEPTPEPAAEVQEPEADADDPSEDRSSDRAELERDDVEDGGERRDLEMLEAAAAATAMSIARAEQEPFDQELAEDAEPRDLDDELPQPGDPLVEELVHLQAGDEREGEDAEEAAEPQVFQDDDDPTDQLEPVDAAGVPMLDPFDANDEDLLRTTAQLAILSDDLDVRGRAEDDDDGTSARSREDDDRDERDAEA